MGHDDHGGNRTDPLEVRLGNTNAVGVARGTNVPIGINVSANNRQTNNPPSQRSTGEKKVFGSFNALGEANAHIGDKRHIGDDDGEIDRMQVFPKERHRVIDGHIRHDTAPAAK